MMSRTEAEKAIHDWRDALHRRGNTGGFYSVVDELEGLQARKQADYGTQADPWANLRAGEPYGVPAWVHASIMADHKSHRIQSFVTKGKLENEGVRDSLIDRAVYAIAAIVLFDEADG